jgi:hypothetical protein
MLDAYGLTGGVGLAGISIVSREAVLVVLSPAG